jgi:iron(III) transport system substrate-binding protein
MKAMVKTRTRSVVCGYIATIASLLVGCRRENLREVVVYSALDEEFSQPIFEEFTKQTGIIVRAKYDAESTKTVGLVQAILTERERPRCDLFWNNEILNTYRLERAGLLRAYKSPSGEKYPASVRSPAGLWYGFAARARVLIVNTDQVPREQWPKSVRDLADPRWSKRGGMAKPLFGTTATHAACLFAAWGDNKATEFFRAVKGNAQIMSGNRQVAEAVAGNSMAFGLTDTDDALSEIEKNYPVTIVYPDQEKDGLGTLFIPNTVALIKDSPHQREAEKLLDYLLSAEVERRLADGPSAQIPLQPGVAASNRVKTPRQVKAMEVDWSVAAAKWDSAARFLEAEFTGAE